MCDINESIWFVFTRPLDNANLHIKVKHMGRRNHTHTHTPDWNKPSDRHLTVATFCLHISKVQALLGSSKS